MPDGESILVRRQSLVAAPGVYPGSELRLMILHTSGGRGVMVPGTDRIPGLADPSPTPDGRAIYFSVRAGDGSLIQRHDRQTEQTLAISGGPGAAVRPTLSRDGRLLAFVKRIDADSALVVRDLTTGEERIVRTGLGRDLGEGVTDDPLLPGFAFMPDSRSVVLSLNGKVQRVDVASGAAAVIPFTARVQQTFTQRVQPTVRIDDGPVPLKMLRWMHATPDGTQLLFGAAGKIFRFDRAAGRVLPFADAAGLEYSPAISPDGKVVAFVRWLDAGVHVFRAPLAGGDEVQLTTAPGLYQHLSWSPDGSRLVFVQPFRGVQNFETVFSEIRWLDATRPGPSHLVASLKPRGIRRQAVRPIFDRSGQRIYYAENGDLGWLSPRNTDLMSARLDGTDRRRHLRFVWADDIIPSPDERLVAFTEGHEVFVTPLPPTGGDAVEVRARGTNGLPVRRLSTDGGDFIYWSNDGKWLTWSLGATFYRRSADSLLSDSPSKAETFDVGRELPRARPDGRIALRGARVITMRDPQSATGRQRDAPSPDEGVIERADLVVERGRIVGVGRAGSLNIPSDAKIIDVSGKTIIPGFVDVHDHYEYRDDLEIFPERNWVLAVNLAYGVTTMRDPSARSQMIFTLAEMVETGAIVGPRLFSTGDLLWGQVPCCDPIESLDDARHQIRRLKKQGATSLKQYALPRREQQQWVVQAAREAALPVTTHTISRTRTQLAVAMDGHTGLEHAFVNTPLYKDALAVLERTGVFYSPTLVASARIDTYFHQTTDVHGKAKLRRFTPHAAIDANARRLQTMPDEEYPFHAKARVAADIVRAGGRVVLGSHGINREGLGAHWELWAFVMGGMTPMEALHAGTAAPAASLGMQKDIGSLEVGKLADLIVLDANPLDDIRNTEKILYVMRGGVLWHGDTLDEIWPKARRFGPFYWEREQVYPPGSKQN